MLPKLLLIALISSSWSLYAAPIESLTHIRETVRAFVVTAADGGNRQVEVTVGQLDPRLRLVKCELPLGTSWSPGGRQVGHTTIGVRCDGQTPWTLFVPVTIKQRMALVVAARPLARGQLLTAEDIAVEQRAVADASEIFFSTPDSVVGKTITRNAPVGVSLTQDMLKVPRAVKRGDIVTLAMSAGPVSVRMQGTAMKDGVVGERIPVRNKSSSRIVEGIVSEAGVVVVQAAANF